VKREKQFLRNFEQLGGIEVAQTGESLQLHKTMDRQQSTTQRNRIANSDSLWHQEKMRKTFSSKRN
jgi:hypothetical protein